MSKLDETLWTLKKRESGSVYKKLPFATLKAWILEARIDPEDYVTNDELGKWIRISKIQQLKSYFSPKSSTKDAISREDIFQGWQGFSEDEEELSLDMTPMIDITFLLLIFFMVTATFAIHEVKNVTVPKAQHTEKHKQHQDITVSIDANKKIYVGKREVTLSSLEQVLKQEVAQSAQQNIVLSADRSLEYDFVMQVLDAVNGTGIKDVKLKLQKRNN